MGARMPAVRCALLLSGPVMARAACEAAGTCGAAAATQGAAMLQFKTSLGSAEGLDTEGGEDAPVLLGMRTLVSQFRGQTIINSSEALLQGRSSLACTAAERDEFLAVTNKYRCMHGAPPLVWSDAMAESANTYVSPLESLRHSRSYSLPPPAGPAGENLYWSSWPSSPTEVVSAWYDEVDDCIGGPEAFTDGCRNGQGGRVVGHFTALIWKGAISMGCAWNNDREIAICRYKAGDSLSAATPNVLPTSNYIAQVGTRVKTEAQCAAASGDSATASPTASPTTSPTAAPTPAPTPAATTTTPAATTTAPAATTAAAAPATTTTAAETIIVEADPDQCVSGAGVGGCVMRTSGCGGHTSFTFTCSRSGRRCTFQVGMPDNYRWNFGSYCSECSDIQVRDCGR
mmetsp:Transcript_59069/g.189977  ORF Transcript_59069/g.189977 Transcript_59069/m.189977 type:complete len:401 (-) Transcript_59069:311-1513(-)